MFANFVRIVAALVCASLACVYAQDTQSQGSSIKVSQTCLGCICEAASGCNTTLGCNGEVCGPFRITWGYWADGGKPTLNDEPNSAEGAYSRCVNEPFCAARAIEGYMNKFGQDCNGDGVINCDDFVRIHRLGGYGCSGGLDVKYENAYKACIQTFG
ncbi:lysozyme-like [Orussus abietinus]|uniref:lysozyme-like n=1 Tax=Orussus abietinus TaxID=222816 RepID=UPI000626D452|nr:lysozyme-like [Orussus abietinus]